MDDAALMERLEVKKTEAEYLEPLIRKAYDVEHDRKDKMLNNMNAIVAAFGGILAGFNFVISRLPPIRDELSILIWVLTASSVYFVGLAFWNAWKLVCGGNYQHIRSPDGIISSVKDDKIFLCQETGEYGEGSIKENLRLNLIVELANAATHNCRVNDRRALQRVNLYKLLAISAILISVIFSLEVAWESINTK
ncbi:hypothetical protein [Roseomonas genomospecies 6]|uniref:hypothetical protein n=1 Tax=Roseomonas genomospecies 6 TaxID=214106 RepID=UPI0011F162F8|nr:hypothetical protein [Roseomonas genomospecies 6]